MDRQKVKILSINVNGLNAPKKREKNRTFHQIQKFKADAVCLQETHIKNEDQKYLIRNKLGKSFIAADGKQKKRGVAIYAKEFLNPEMLYKLDDGRILIISIKRKAKTCLILNIYAPNQNQNDFYEKVRKVIADQIFDEVCVIGDFNAVYEDSMDRKRDTKKIKQGNILPKSFLKMIDELSLVAPWRIKNINRKDFTFYSARHQSWSRLVMVWTSIEMTNDIWEAEILPASFVDHNPILLMLTDAPKRGRWTMNINNFRDEKILADSRVEYQAFFQG